LVARWLDSRSRAATEGQGSPRGFAQRGIDRLSSTWRTWFAELTAVSVRKSAWWTSSACVIDLSYLKQGAGVSNTSFQQPHPSRQGRRSPPDGNVSLTTIPAAIGRRREWASLYGDTDNFCRPVSHSGAFCGWVLTENTSPLN
jgi:hypothetical protein